MSSHAERRDIDTPKAALREIDRVRLWAKSQGFLNIADALERALAALPADDR